MIQTYITRLILSYADRYILNISARLKLGFWGGDVQLANLELRPAVLQAELGVSQNYTLQRGLIRDLTIHVPWTAITSAPVQITLAGIELQVKFSPQRKPASGKLSPEEEAKLKQQAEEQLTKLLSSEQSASAAAAAAASTATASSSGVGSGWAVDLITKILANLTVTVKDIHFRYVEEDSTASLLIRELSLFSCSSSAFQAGWTEVETPWKRIRKSIRLDHAALYLALNSDTKHASNNQPVDAVEEMKQHFASDFVPNPEDALLSNLSLNVRCESYLAALGTQPYTRIPSDPLHYPSQCSAAITLDIHSSAPIDVQLSQRQYKLLQRIIQEKQAEAEAGLFYSTSASAARMAQSLASVPQQMAQGQNANGAMAHSSSDPNESKAAQKQGWLNWMWNGSKTETTTEFEDAASAANEVPDEDLTLSEYELFQTMFGHLAPSDEIVFCLHLQTLSVHLRNPCVERLNVPTTRRLLEQLQLPGTSAPPTVSTSQQRNSSATAPTQMSRNQNATAPEPQSIRGGSSSRDAAARSALPITSVFASLHIEEVHAYLAQPLALSKPPAAAGSSQSHAPVRRLSTSRRAPLSAPASPVQSCAAPATALKPPILSLDVKSLIIVDETEDEPRSVLRCGRDSWVRESFDFMTQTEAPLPVRHSPFENRGAPCLHLKQKADELAAKQAPHVISVEQLRSDISASNSRSHSPDISRRSNFGHSVSTATASRSQQQSNASHLRGSYSPKTLMHKSSLIKETSNAPVHAISIFHSVRVESKQNTGGSSNSSAVKAASKLNNQSSSRHQRSHSVVSPPVVTSFRCCADVVFGPVALLADLTSSGTSRLVTQLTLFLAPEPHARDDHAAASKPPHHSDPASKPADAAPSSGAASSASATTATVDTPLASTISIECRICLQHVLCALRVTHPVAAAAAKLPYNAPLYGAPRDSSANSPSPPDTLLFELAGVVACFGWSEDAPETESQSHSNGSVESRIIRLSNNNSSQPHSPLPPPSHQRLDGISIHLLSIGFRSVNFISNQWRQERSVSRPGAGGYSPHRAASHYDSYDSAPADDLEDDSLAPVLELHSLTASVSVPFVDKADFAQAASASVVAYLLQALDASPCKPQRPHDATAAQQHRNSAQQPAPRNANSDDSDEQSRSASASAARDAGLNVSLGKLSSSLMLRDLHFVLCVASACCGLYDRLLNRRDLSRVAPAGRLASSSYNATSHALHKALLALVLSFQN